MGIKSNLTVPIPILGLDTSKPSEYIDNRATPNCQNIIIDSSTIRKRLGFTAIGDSLGERVLALKEFFVGTTGYVVRVGYTKLELLNQTTEAWGAKTGAAMTATGAARVSTAIPLLSGNRILAFTNFTDNIRKFNGVDNSSDLGGTPPKAKFMIEYNNYLVLGYVLSGGDTFTMRVQWSDTGNIEEWALSNAGYTDLIQDGGDITGLGIFGNYLTVHKENSIYLGYLVPTSSVFEFDRRETGVGTVNFSTIQSLSIGEQIFLARDGLHIFNGSSAPLVATEISDEIRKGINAEYIYKCWSVIAQEYDEYWVAIPMGSQTEPDTIYKYNYKTGQCYKDTASSISAAGVYKNTGALTWDDITHSIQSDTTRWDDILYSKLFPTLIFGSSAGVTSYKDNVNNDIGVAINTFWESKDYFGEDVNRLSRWQELEVIAKGNSLNVYYSIDGGNSWNYITQITLSADYPTEFSPYMCYFDVVARKIRYKFSNNTLGESFTLKQFTIKQIPRESIR